MDLILLQLYISIVIEMIAFATIALKKVYPFHKLPYKTLFHNVFCLIPFNHLGVFSHQRE